MEIGDLLTSKQVEGECSSVTLLVVDIKKHPLDAKMDKVCLHWMPVRNCKRTKGEFSRHIVEKHYEVLSNG